MEAIKQQERLVSGEIAGIGAVTFKCRWWSKDVEVEMVSPYPGIKDGTHMLLAVPTRYGEEADCIDWQDVAWRLVRGILAREEWKESHREAYEKRMRESRRVREEILDEIGKLKDRLTEARRTRVGGWCGAVLYGSKVKRLKKEMREWEQLAMEEEECRWLPTLMEKYKEVTN